MIFDRIVDFNVEIRNKRESYIQKESQNKDLLEKLDSFERIKFSYREELIKKDELLRDKNDEIEFLKDKVKQLEKINK